MDVDELGPLWEALNHQGFTWSCHLTAGLICLVIDGQIYHPTGYIELAGEYFRHWTRGPLSHLIQFRTVHGRFPPLLPRLL